MKIKYSLPLIIICVVLKLSASTGIAYFISGPSAAGKTTLSNTLTAQLLQQYQLSNYILYTTRAKRPSETEGVDYYFLTNEEFKQKEQEGFFIHTIQYDQHSYGYPKNIIEEIEIGKSYFIITAYESTKELQKLIPSSISIWIDVKELNTLKERLLIRHSDDLDKFYRRYHLAIEERERECIAPSCQYHILNDDFEEAKKQLFELIHQSFEGVVT